METHFSAGINKVIIEIDLKQNQTIQFENGTKLFIDTDWNPQHHAPRSGIVRGVPWKLYFNPKHPHESMKWKTTIEIEVGDTVFFDYSASVIALGKLANPVLRDSEAEVNSRYFTRDDTLYLVLDYSDLYAVEREGNIKPLNGHVFVSPLPEDRIKTSLILPDHDLVKKKPNNQQRAEVMIVGSINGEYTSPKFNDAIEIYEGDEVFFTRFAMLQVEYELHARLFPREFDVHVIQRKYIIAKVDK